MQGAELRLAAMGATNAGRWPTMAEGSYRRRPEERRQEMRLRARAAETAYRDREAWEASRAAQVPRHARRMHRVRIATAGVFLSLLIIFVVPHLV